jgi:hypothetical protein
MSRPSSDGSTEFAVFISVALAGLVAACSGLSHLAEIDAKQQAGYKQQQQRAEIAADASRMVALEQGERFQCLKAGKSYVGSYSRSTGSVSAHCRG